MVRRHLSYANVVATMALLFAMTGGALAASHYLVSSTKQINPKVLKQLQGRSGKTGATGPTGSPGAQGKEGTQGKEGKEGTPATSLWARVKFDGTLETGSGTVSAGKVLSGYEVVFNRNVSACAYIATLGSASVSANNTLFDEKTARARLKPNLASKSPTRSS